MAIDRRTTFSIVRGWSAHQVPQHAVEIDFDHPQARGLVGLYIPGGRSGFRDLCSIGPALTPHTAGTFGQSSLGPGLNCNANSSGASSSVRPTQYEFASTNAAVVHLGYHLATQATGSDSPIVALNRSGGGSPYYPWNLALFNNANGITFECSAGGPFNTAVLADIGINSLAVTFGTQNGNSVTMYKNGTSLGGGSLTSAITYYSDDLFEIGVNTAYQTRYYNGISLAAWVYNTGSVQMPASTVAWLAREPFAMLRPVVRRSYCIPGVVAAAPTTQARAMVMA